MIAGFITVRSTSTRLLRKCFLPFGKWNVIEHIINRAKHYALEPIICTSTDPSDDIINILGEPYIRSKNKIISSKSGLGLGTFIGKTLLERMKANVEFGKCPKTNGAMVTIQWQTDNLLSI